ncbi:DNA polymerase III subunit epsilon [Mangrovivirga cuniculi]|uniref:Excinuclease cho n=2 Tax=Mangrovivirga cuniculi TaxID=2715131 RepID=A0A4D7JKT6_9BACT|nr:DNA polymerase III subunit epsilon [Mangrovivirga cuniculi]
MEPGLSIRFILLLIREFLFQIILPLLLVLIMKLSWGPSFSDISDEVISILNDSIFVAHNVNFDYHFVRQELKTSGYQWDSKKLCTVRYARKIFPGLKSYGLGKLSAHLGYTNKARHRAYGDASVTAEILHLMISRDNLGVMEKLISHGSVHGYIPPNLDENEFRNLPELPGVYYFHDGKGKTLYIGKAKNIKKRVKSHFSTRSGKPELSFLNQIHHLAYDLCGNELISLIHENEMIKKHWPPFNRAQKFNSRVFSLVSYKDGSSYLRHGVAPGRKPNLLMTFNSLMESRNYLFAIAKEYSLCPKLLGLQKVKSKCSWVDAGECNGACIGEEPYDEYNKRVEEWHSSINSNNSDFLIVGEGRDKTEVGFVVVRKNLFKGYGFAPTEVSIIDQWEEYIHPGIHDADVQRILNQFINHNSSEYDFLPI